MKYCSKCGTAMDDNAVFCSACGEKQAPTVAQPVYNPENQVPVQTVEPLYTPAYDPNILPQKTVSVKDKVFGFVGFGLSTFAFTFSIICFFMAAVSLESYVADPAIISFMYTILFFPCAIIGLIFSKKSREAGNEVVFTKLGKVFGIISIIVFAIVFFLAIIGISEGAVSGEVLY